MSVHAEVGHVPTSALTPLLPIAHARTAKLPFVHLLYAALESRQSSVVAFLAIVPVIATMIHPAANTLYLPELCQPQRQLGAHLIPLLACIAVSSCASAQSSYQWSSLAGGPNSKDEARISVKTNPTVDGRIAVSATVDLEGGAIDDDTIRDPWVQLGAIRKTLFSGTVGGYLAHQKVPYSAVVYFDQPTVDSQLRVGYTDYYDRSWPQLTGKGAEFAVAGVIAAGGSGIAPMQNTGTGVVPLPIAANTAPTSINLAFTWAGLDTTPNQKDESLISITARNTADGRLAISAVVTLAGGAVDDDYMVNPWVQLGSVRQPLFSGTVGGYLATQKVPYSTVVYFDLPASDSLLQLGYDDYYDQTWPGLTLQGGELAVAGTIAGSGGNAVADINAVTSPAGDVTTTTTQSPTTAGPALLDDPYDLPQPLVAEDGTVISTAQQWRDLRRPEILRQFAEQVYGKTPDDTLTAQYNDIEIDRNALNGKATRKQVRVVFNSAGHSVSMDLLLYLPNQSTNPSPVFLGLNFNGNHTIHTDPAIRLPRSPVDTPDYLPREADRGNRSWRWPVEEIIARGYGLATVYYGDIDPDYDDGFNNGIHPLFYTHGQSRPADDEWGAIGAWAWGLSRSLDYLVGDADVAADRVAVMGFSRLGKTALWAGAQDERFALVISNESGTLGASLSRRDGIAPGKESIARITGKYGYWFARNAKQYAYNPALIPVDQHQLIALIAPRSVYIASAQNDSHSDPQGEFESGLYASPVYRLLGTDGMSASRQPPLNTPVMSTIGYHIRSGNHDVTLYDWQRFIAFADTHMAQK
jgi:hypothetical protein